MTKTLYDVAVIGAGPVGSYTAYRLAKQGHSVLLLEEHPIIGEPRHCTGVLGREAYSRFPDLPREPIHTELTAAWIISPGGERVRSTWFEKQAYVIHRARFDQALSQMAVQAGAELRTACRVNRIDRQSHGLRFHLAGDGAGGDTAEARSAIIATGSSYRLQGPLGFPIPSAHLYCAQTEVGSDEIKDVEVYIGSHVAPGSFAWAVPLGNGRVRVGVTAHRMATQHLEELLASPHLASRIRRAGERVVKRPVPIRPVERSASDRILLVGDAAGQVKPTTGGGIYYGLIGSEIASETLSMGLRSDRLDLTFLSSYDRRWKRALGGEMLMGWMGRKVFEHISDRKLDRLVAVCRHKSVEELINPIAEFDWHSKAVFSFLRSPRVISALL